MKRMILGTDWWTDCDDAETGENYFTSSPNGLHAYVIKKYENAYYQNAIDRIICGEEF